MVDLANTNPSNTQSRKPLLRWSFPNECRDKHEKTSPKQNQPELDLRLSFLRPGETEKPQSEKTSLSNAVKDRFRSEPNTSVKRKDRREFRQRLKLKKKNAAKKEDGVIDLTTSDNDDIAAASSHSSTEVQAEPNDNINFDDGHSDGNDVADPLLDQRTTQQEHAKTPGNSGEELSDQEAAQLLWRCVLRAREKAAQEGLEPVSPWSSETEEDHDVPWSLEEDEELARWKIGGHSGEMLDWPTFDESRTWEQLMKRLAWLEGQHPKCWAALKAVEEEEQEVFERELSVDIEEMKVKGLLPSSSDEMSEDETETESVEASDEEANEE